MSENDHFDFSEYSLFEYKLKEMSGFLFAFLGGTALSLERQLGDFKKLHAPWSLDSLITTRRQDFDVNCNWKAFLDVFNEYYHLDFVHPSSIGNLYLKPEVQDSTIGDFASQFGRTSGTGALLESEQQSTLPMIDGLVEPWSLGARYTWVFPNMAFAAGKEAVWLYEAYPINPNRCHVKQSICFPQSTTKLADFEEKSQAYYQRLDAAMDEDITALENQQQGLRNSPPLQGRFSKLMEANVASFVNWYATKLTET
jgi:phenylpropionate dioxygenase-like ring-hydroxylating dioxygenase large terminal subunit